MTEIAPITAADTIGTWLDHPRGGAVLREQIAQWGADAEMLAPARTMPLQQLVDLSGGALTAEMVRSLVLAANDGIEPPTAATEERRPRQSAQRFDGHCVIVTGAASGIGRATATRIAAEGGTVVAVDLSADGLASLAAAGEGAPGKIITVTADLTTEAGIARAVDATDQPVTGLANVAGINDDFSPAHEVTDVGWSRVFAVNVDAVVKLIRAVVPTMIEARRGSIVNVASEAALRGSAAGIAYTASKHAVVGITRSCAFMYGASGIRTNAVAPGGVSTGMPMPELSEFGRTRTGPLLATIPSIAAADQIAASITFLLSDDGVNVNGAILPSDGGWSVQ
ncbi:SDR family NAD(P)-dependent oxidoreductase [Rhodococcoides yunnanense]|uniref:SDR family NAD(P)-dependent oxidoreductase n=1 Tax=Rhodococcoides yunnanense TaxID=278209 RepID=UPI000934487B|nr:SDR family NAD(P)-dependent oxidoreductase [Rhodococcus yunnanensis]